MLGLGPSRKLDSIGKNDGLDRINGSERRFEIPWTVAFCDEERRSFQFVVRVPKIDVSAHFVEVVYHQWDVLVGGAVHGCFAVGVNGVDVCS